MASIAPGYAVLELINVTRAVVSAAAAFVSAFSGKWDNAVFELQELDGHYRHAEYYLLTLEQNIRDQGRRYPNYQALQRTLQEYKEFLDEYKSLLVIEIDKPQTRWQTLRSHTKSLETAKSTAQWVLSKERAVRLKERIIACTQEINQFNNSISNDQLRVLMSDFDASISSKIQELKEGLIAEINASPTLPLRSKHTTLVGSGWNQALWPPSQSRSQDNFEPTSFSTSSSEFPSSPTQVRHLQHISRVFSVNIGHPAAFTSYPAKITIKKSKPRLQEKVELSYGDITWDGHQLRVIACINTDTGLTVDHKFSLSERVFPHTLHSAKNEPPYEVYFLRDFSLDIRETGKASQIVLDDPRYLFENSADCSQFQSWLRCKQSVETFEVDTVKASQNAKLVDGVLADEVVLKIWKDAFDGPSLSLFANNLTREKKADMHLEFPMTVFKYNDILRQAEEITNLKLEFEVPKKESTKVRGIFRGRKSKDMTSDQDPFGDSSSTSSMTTVSRASISPRLVEAQIRATSIHRRSASSKITEMASPLTTQTPTRRLTEESISSTGTSYMPDSVELARRLLYLEMEFATSNECAKFSEAFLKAHKLSTQRSTQTSSPETSLYSSVSQSPNLVRPQFDEGILKRAGPRTTDNAAITGSRQSRDESVSPTQRAPSLVPPLPAPFSLEEKASDAAESSNRFGSEAGSSFWPRPLKPCDVMKLSSKSRAHASSTHPDLSLSVNVGEPFSLKWPEAHRQPDK